MIQKADNGTIIIDKWKPIGMPKGYRKLEQLPSVGTQSTQLTLSRWK